MVLYLGPFLLVAGLLLNPRSVADGSFARLDVRVPNERDHASRRITWTAASQRFWIAPSSFEELGLSLRMPGAPAGSEKGSWRFRVR